jgi:hypothetical protein
VQTNEINKVLQLNVRADPESVNDKNTAALQLHAISGALETFR